MRWTAGLIAGAALLTGCGDNSKDVALENVSVAEAAKQAQAANRLEPGQWESTVQIVSAEMPGAPPAVADALKKAASAQTAKSARCLTPEEANKPAADLLSGGQSKDCRYETFTMANGRIDAVMVCKPQAGQPGEMRMTMGGAYTPARFDIDMKMNMGAMPGLPAGQGMVMTAKAQGRRVGECTTAG